MKKLVHIIRPLLFIISFIVLSLCLKAQDMNQYLTETNALVTQGKYEEALTRFIWFHDHALEVNKAMAGVRLSFALSYWDKLAKTYPPAMKALIEMRDRKTALITEDGGSWELFQDVAALNRVLNENKKTITLFETVMKLQPDLAKRDWVVVKNALFTAKRYDIIRTYIGYPLREFSVIEEQYKRLTNTPPSLKNYSAQLKAASENTFVENSLQLIQFSLANDDIKSALEIKQKALGIVQDYRLKTVIIL